MDIDLQYFWVLIMLLDFVKNAIDAIFAKFKCMNIDFVHIVREKFSWKECRVEVARVLGSNLFRENCIFGIKSLILC